MLVSICIDEVVFSCLVYVFVVIFLWWFVWRIFWVRFLFGWFYVICIIFWFWYIVVVSCDGDRCGFFCSNMRIFVFRCCVYFFIYDNGRMVIFLVWIESFSVLRLWCMVVCFCVGIIWFWMILFVMFVRNVGEYRVRGN